LLLDPSQQFLVATVARGIEEEVHQGVRIPLGQGFAGRIADQQHWVAIEQTGWSSGDTSSSTTTSRSSATR
jgi:phosphoserine phosphatase RsbU/P